MLCDCRGGLIKFNRYRPNRGDPFAQCDKCFKIYTWKEYRALQADKIIKLVKEQESNINEKMQMGDTNPTN